MSRLVPVLAGLVAAGVVLALLSAGGGEQPRAAASLPAADGRAVFARMGCGGCHRLAAARSRGHAGPDLDAVLGSYDAASLRRQIVDPAPSEGFAAMPTGFGERMTGAELSALVAFLLGSAD